MADRTGDRLWNIFSILWKRVIGYILGWVQNLRRPLMQHKKAFSNISSESVLMDWLPMGAHQVVRN